jgi:hypothetical protein
VNTRESATTEALAAELDALVAEFAAVRRTKPYPKAPFPLELLERACELDMAAPWLGVLRQLHLDPAKVRARVRVGASAARAAAKSEHAETRRQAAPVRAKGPAKPPRSKPDKRKAAPSRFVAIPLGASSTAHAVTVVVDRGDGLRITFEVTPERASAIIASLIGGAA